MPFTPCSALDSPPSSNHLQRHWAALTHAMLTTDLTLFDAHVLRMPVLLGEVSLLLEGQILFVLMISFFQRFERWRSCALMPAWGLLVCHETHALFVLLHGSLCIITGATWHTCVHDHNQDFKCATSGGFAGPNLTLAVFTEGVGWLLHICHLPLINRILAKTESSTDVDVTENCKF